MWQMKTAKAHDTYGSIERRLNEKLQWHFQVILRFADAFESVNLLQLGQEECGFGSTSKQDMLLR